MEAGKTLANIPSQFAQNRAAMAGVQQYNTLQKAGVAPFITATDASGRAYTIAPGQIQDKTSAAMIWNLLFPQWKQAVSAETEGKGTTPTTPTTPQPKEEPKPPTPEQAATTTPTPNMFASTAQAPAAPAQGPTQTQTDVGIQEALARNQFASTGQGVPAGYQPPPSGPMGAPAGMFLNPATGSYEPLQQGPPPAPPQTNQPTNPLLLANQQAQQQQALQAWHAQNAQPVADSQSALEWAKRFHTGYRTATYLPHGGPNLEPAYNFSDGKSSNIVPVSQMVKNGFGPSVIAQNTSSALNVADQISQQGQGPQGPQGPGLPMGPVSPTTQTPQPTTQTPQPTTQPPQSQVAQAGPAWNPQTPAPLAGPPPAPGYNPAPYRLAVQQAIAQPGNLLAQNAPSQAGARSTDNLPPGTPIHQDRTPITDSNPIATPQNVSQGDQNRVMAAASAMRNLSPEEAAATSEDRDVPVPGLPWHFKKDDTPGTLWYGRAYTEMPPVPGQPWNPNRWYLGEDGYKPIELPQSGKWRQMQYWVDRGQISVPEVKKLSDKGLNDWLAEKFREEHFSMSPPDTGTLNTIGASGEYVKAIAQVRDNLSALKALGENPTSIGKFWNALMGGASSLGMGYGADPFVIKAYKNLEQSVDRADWVANNYKNLLVEQGKGGGQEPIKLPLWLAGGRIGAEISSPSVPKSSKLSDVFGGSSVGSKLMDIDAIYKDATQRHEKLIGDAHDQWMRISPRHYTDVDALKENKELDDPLNEYKGGRVPVAYEDYDEFQRNHRHTNIILRMPNGDLINGRTH